MLSDTPKPLQTVAGRAILSHILHALADSGLDEAVVVVPPDSRGNRIRDAVGQDQPDGMDVRFAVQPSPNGTAGAAVAARPSCDGHADVLIINGDLALLTAQQIAPLLNAPQTAVAVATATVDDPAGMGRIVRDGSDRIAAIVEQRDATPAQALVREVNVGIYRFRADWLWRRLDGMAPSDTRQSSERYLTDTVQAAAAHGEAVAVEVGLPEGRLNVESLSEVAHAESVLRARITNQLLKGGVAIRDPGAVWIDAAAVVEPGAAIEPGVHLRGATYVGSGSRIGPNVILDDAQIGENCTLESCTVRSSTLGDGVDVGPYSTIRPGCRIGDRVHIGSTAELKNAALGEGVQVGHFSYVGDTVVGARTNIGAGAITCNFDGEHKHQTVIGADAFIGSDSLLIAPVRIGDRARTGAGSVVTKDVPDDATAVGHPARLAGRGHRSRARASIRDAQPTNVPT